MRALLFLRPLVFGTAAVVLQPAPIAGPHSAGLSTRQETAVVRRLVSAVNGRRLTAVEALFVPSAVVRVNAGTWAGRKSVNRWLRAELLHRLHMTFQSGLLVDGRTARAAIHRGTLGGDCPTGCDEKARWHFSDSGLDGMTLLRLRAPVPPLVPTVPPPPTAPPSPRVTPTIPS